MSRDYLQTIARLRTQHGEKFSPVGLAPQFIPYYQSGQRIEVTRTYPGGETYTRRGTVGMTTGWRPAFLLMSRVSALGSSDLLSTEDKIVKVIQTRKRR